MLLFIFWCFFTSSLETFNVSHNLLITITFIEINKLAINIQTFRKQKYNLLVEWLNACIALCFEDILSSKITILDIISYTTIESDFYNIFKDFLPKIKKKKELNHFWHLKHNFSSPFKVFKKDWSEMCSMITINENHSLCESIYFFGFVIIILAIDHWIFKQNLLFCTDNEK